MMVKQPKTFSFSPENLVEAQRIVSKYPPGRQASAVIPLLDMAQRQCRNWLPQAAMDTVAAMLDMPPVRVYEVASFYTMFNLKPVGKYHIQVCTTTPCWLRGSAMIVQTCQETLGIGLGETTSDGIFTLSEVECLGACVNAPVAQINDDLYEDLTPDSMKAILAALREGRTPAIGSQTGRRGSCAQDGPTTLKDKVNAHA